MWVLKAEEDWLGANELAALKPPLRDLACFHCQQSAEKYLKGLLQEKGVVAPKTHDLDHLLDLLLPYDGTLSTLRRGLDTLNSYAVEYRYPAFRATITRMNAAIRRTEKIRAAVRDRLGLEI